MESAVVSSKFQVVIPEGVRKKMGIKKGQRVVFEPEGKDLRLIVVPSLLDLEGKFPELKNGPSRKELWADENR
jgi:AbrB family looped-hinge helix DNA binding protein